MNSKLEKIENNIAVLEITVSPEKFEEGVKKSYSKNVKKFNIPGFRKGKAPRSVIVKFYGEEVLYEDAINILIPIAYDEAIAEHNLEPVAQPDITIIDADSEKGLIFKAEVVLMPEVTLGQYKGIEAVKKEYNVTEEDINKELESMREQNARIVDVTDRPIQKGDTTVIDFKGFVDDEQFEGGTAENYRLEIGSGQFIPGFEEQLIGAEIGKEVDVNVTFPEAYRSEKLAGKPALFKVTVKEVKEKQLPELNDDFAKDISDYETLDEIKNSIRTRQETAAKKMEEDQYGDAVLAKVADNATVDIPQVMVDTQINSMLRSFDYQLQSEGLNLETYMKYMGAELETLKESYKEPAYKKVKTQLVLSKIAETEGIGATDEDVDAEIEKFASQYNQPASAFKDQLTEQDIEYMKETIIVQKVLDLLVANSVAVEEAKAPEAEAQTIENNVEA